MKIVVALAAMALVACGREEASSTFPVETGKNTQKTDAKKVDKPDDAPSAVDSTKDGY